MSSMDKSSSVSNSFGVVARKCDNYFCCDYFCGFFVLFIDDEGDSVFFFLNFEIVFVVVDVFIFGSTRFNRGSDVANLFFLFVILL